MSNFDFYFAGEEAIKKKNYKEYVLDSVDENNLKDIEKSLEKGIIDSTNKKMMLDYLFNLHKKISEIKRNEFEYEGENNMNVNMYLNRIRKLIEKIQEI